MYFSPSMLISSTGTPPSSDGERRTMAPTRKRVRDLKRTAKDFPRYRELIDNRGWVPHVFCDTSGAYWDGFTVRDRDGQLPTGLSGPGQKQMINMILDG